MNKEYVTTLGQYRQRGRNWHGDYQDEQADAPDPPEGSGWRLVGLAAADGLLFFAWERDAAKEKDP